MVKKRPLHRHPCTLCTVAHLWAVDSLPPMIIFSAKFNWNVEIGWAYRLNNKFHLNIYCTHCCRCIAINTCAARATFVLWNFTAGSSTCFRYRLLRNRTISIEFIFWGFVGWCIARLFSSLCKCIVRYITAAAAGRWRLDGGVVWMRWCINNDKIFADIWQQWWRIWIVIIVEYRV